MVIDDDTRSGPALEALLSANGWDARHVNGAQQALAQLRSWTPHLFIVDVTMPEKDGFAVAQLLRSMHASRNAPLIAYTSLSTDDLRERASLEDFDGYCQKGSPPDGLLELIAGFFLESGEAGNGVAGNQAAPAGEK